MRPITSNRILNWQIESFNLLRFDIVPETNVSLQKIFHDEIAIIGFKDSAWMCTQNGQRYLETPDCLIVRDAGQVFSVDTHYIAKGGATCREIRISPQGLQDFCYTHEMGLSAINFSQPMMHCQVLRNQFFLTHDILESSGCLLEASSYASVFLRSLMHENRSKSIAGESCDSMYKIKLVMEYLRANFAQNVSLSFLSQLAQSNPFVLLRQFKKVTGLAPHGYLQTYRVIKAKEFISKGLLLKDVAQLCGFADQSHLTRLFKRKVGVTPGQYLSGSRFGDNFMTVH